MGTVRDLSQTGMKVASETRLPYRKGDSVELTLRAGNRQIRLQGEVAWKKRCSLKVCEYGIRFVNLSSAMSKAVGAAAKFGMIPGGATAGERQTRKKPAQNTRASADGLPPEVVAHVPDYYHALGVDTEANLEDIHDAFRKHARASHPDVNPDADAQRKFMEIAAAYQVLKDARRRKSYDALRQRALV